MRGAVHCGWGLNQWREKQSRAEGERMASCKQKAF